MHINRILGCHDNTMPKLMQRTATNAEIPILYQTTRQIINATNNKIIAIPLVAEFSSPVALVSSAAALASLSIKSGSAGTQTSPSF